MRKMHVMSEPLFRRNICTVGNTNSSASALRLMPLRTQGEQQADATIFGRHDAAIVWRQRLLRYSVFLAVLAGAGVGAGLSFTNGEKTA